MASPGKEDLLLDADVAEKARAELAVGELVDAIAGRHGLLEEGLEAAVVGFERLANRGHRANLGMRTWFSRWTWRRRSSSSPARPEKRVR